MRVSSVKYLETPIQLSRHYHDGHQLLYVVSGKILVTIDGELHTATAGDLVVLSRFEEHSIQVVAEPYKRYAVRVSPEASSYLSDDAVLSSVLANRAATFRHVTPIDPQKAEPIFRKMAEEYSKDDEMGRQMMDLLLRQFLIDLFRDAPSLFISNVNQGTLMVREIQTRMERECGEVYTLSALAANYHVSASHLAHAFKDVTGYAPVEYLMMCRISSAKKRLSATDHPIGEIAAACGFGDESNFCRTFKKRTGVTPTAFRKQYRSQKS